jgi:hypothetical protein
MNRGGLKIAAIVLGTAIVLVPFLGLDGLPHDLRRHIGEERTAVAAAQKQLQSAQDKVLGDLRSDPDLFAGVPASKEWPERLSKALGDLQYASREMDQLSAIEKRNRKSDRAEAEAMLAKERGLRIDASAAVSEIQKDAERWVDFKKHLPEELQAMEREYNQVHGAELSGVEAAVEQAGKDWPDKKSDLDSRLASSRDLQAKAESAWQSTAEARRTLTDIPALVAAAATLKDAADALPKKEAELRSISAQLYTAWDKVLVDMETKRGDEYDQKIRTVTTQFDDNGSKPGKVSSDEKWVQVSKGQYDAHKSDLGMTIEHKSAGKYDVEAERVAEPAGFAYMAPPGQRNQYGYWDHRDGRDFWVFYGQYALLRDLLFNYRYVPLPRGEWEEYRTYRSRGQTYYGRDQYGSQGRSTAERYSGSTFAKGGGFKDSKYAPQSGSYSNSKYASPGGDRTPRQFGSGSSQREEPRAAPRPAPRPSYRPPSAPRRYGKR